MEENASETSRLSVSTDGSSSDTGAESASSTSGDDSDKGRQKDGSNDDDEEVDVALTDDVENAPLDEHSRLRAKAKKLFLQLQLFSASLGAFAHGANDTANAIGPFAAIYFLWSGQDSIVMDVPVWIIALGGFSIVIGLSLLGHRVIQTMGSYT
jgi:phosphate/sulfate permease